MLNGSAAILISSYLLAVLMQGRKDALIDFLIEERAFLKWLGTLMALLWIYRMMGGKGGEIVKNLVLLGFVGLLVTRGESIFNEINKLLITGGGKTK